MMRNRCAVLMVGALVAGCGSTAAVPDAAMNGGPDAMDAAAVPESNDAADAGAPRCVLSGGIGLPDNPPCEGEERALGERPYCVHAPADRGQPLPVVLLLHGYGSSGQQEASYLGLDALVEQRGFILVKPNGVANALGDRYWNAFAACCAGTVNPAPPDDVAYLGQVLDDVASAFSVDAARLTVVGHSNGAFMAHRLACDLSARIAGIVSLAGAVDPTVCHPTRPVSVVEVHGTADQVIRYQGGNTPRNPTAYLAVDDTLAFWAGANGCGARSVVATMDLVCDPTNTAETTIERHAGCGADSTVELWKLDGVGHIPDFFLPTWPARVLDFLLRR